MYCSRANLADLGRADSLVYCLPGHLHMLVTHKIPMAPICSIGTGWSLLDLLDRSLRSCTAYLYPIYGCLH